MMEGFDIMGADDWVDYVGAVSLRPPPPMSQFIPDMRIVQGIPYDGSKGTPNGYVGSYGLFAGTTNYSPDMGDNLFDSSNPLMRFNPIYAASANSALGDEHYGYVWGSFDQDNVPGGIPWGGRLQEGKWNEVFGRYAPGASGDFNRVATPAEAFASATQASKHGKPFGPLVGNPAMPDFAKMRVDAKGNMFWFPSEAPKWLRRPFVASRKPATKTFDRRRMDASRAWGVQQAGVRAQRAATQAAQDAMNAEAERRATEEAQRTIAEARRAKEEAIAARQNFRDGFDVLGADDGLANQYIVVRVKHIDPVKLSNAIGGGSKGQLASSALTVVNTIPKAVLDAAIPIGKSKALEYGVDADISTYDVPPKLRVRALSEFWPGLLVGIVLGGFSLGIVKLFGKLIGPAHVAR